MSQSRLNNLTGLKFGNLTVVSKIGLHTFPNGRKQSIYKCKCSCGKTSKALSGNLRSGHTKSCRCGIIKNITKHGLFRHPIYNAWHQMRQRCFNEKCKAYKHYGKRGITMCRRWLEFNNFVIDMLPSWKRGLSVERVNVNGNYEPSNCEWISRSDQPNNTRVTRKWPYFDKIKTTRDLARIAGTKTHLMYLMLMRGVPANVAIERFKQRALQ